MNNLPTVETHQPNIERVSTGLYSLDVACKFQHQLGFPLYTIMEIYGQEHIGKSTLAYYLAGKVANQTKPDGRVAVCDFEGLDVEHLARAVGQGGFQGTVKLIDILDNKGKIKTHEDMLDEWIAELRNESTSCGIIDSIGAMQTISEEEGNLAEGFGAKRAVAIAKLARKINMLRAARQEQEIPLNVFVTNHSHQVVSGMGHQSAGGVVLKYLEAVRCFLYFAPKCHIKNGDDVIAYAIEGRLEKLRYGGKGKTFKFMIVPGFGVRPNLSAMQDCVDLELAERGTTVKVGDMSYGRIGQLVEDDLAGKDDKFSPFYELLEEKRNAIAA